MMRNFEKVGGEKLFEQILDPETEWSVITRNYETVVHNYKKL